MYIVMTQAVYCVRSSECSNLQENCAVLRETSIIARKDLILHLNTTEGVGAGSRTADEQYIAHKYILHRTTFSVTYYSRLSYHTQSEIHKLKICQRRLIFFLAF